MIMYLEQFLASLSSEAITNAFFWILIGIALLGSFCFLRSRSTQRERLSNFAEYAPILLTSVGILGTFTGIVAGLLNFDIDNIDSSISTLLGGMKTAFLTSVIGVALSILLKMFYTVLGKVKSAVNKGMNIEHLVDNFYEQGKQSELQTRHLRAISTQFEAQYQTQTALAADIAAIAKAVGSEAESSLLGQIKLLRSDFNDAQRTQQKAVEQAGENLQQIATQFVAHQARFETFEQHLWREMQHFGELLSKSATEAVINALKQVIVEFNQNLTEQFGDNFKELNQAVVKLVDWQENYKQQLNEMISLYAAGVQSLEATEKSVSDIEQKTQAIPTTMAQLGEVIEINQHQITNLNAHLDTFAELRDRAVTAIPETQKQVDLMLENVSAANTQMTAGLANAATQMERDFTQISAHFAKEMTACTTRFSDETARATQHFSATNQVLSQTAESLVKHQKELNTQQKQSAEQLLGVMKQWQSEFEQNSRKIQDNFAKSVEEMARKQSAETDRLMSHLESESKKALAATGESVNKQLEYIDQSMQKEVERVMREMGSALATISRQFTNDYQKLVEAMGNITRSRY